MTNKHILLTLVLFTLSFFVSKSQTSLTSNLEKHVYTLASDSLQGRAAALFTPKKRQIISSMNGLIATQTYIPIQLLCIHLEKMINIRTS